MVTQTDLLAPKGEIEMSMFPGSSIDDIKARLQVYLIEGYSKAPNNDAAAQAWAYYRAFRAVYLRMSSEPLQSELVDQASAVFDKDQASRFLALSRQKEEEFKAALGTNAGSKRITGTTAVKNRYSW